MSQVIDTSTWVEFRVGDLFAIQPTVAHKLTNDFLFDGGDNPVVVNSQQNNGVGGFTSQPLTEEAGVITFSDTTTCASIFYQPNAFVGYPHVQGMRPHGVYATGWSDLSLMFFATQMRIAASLKGFDYGNKFTRVAAADLALRLPVTPTGEPDWGYMEQVMKERLDRAEAALDALEAASKTAPQVIDTSTWVEFRVGDLFEVSRGANLNMTGLVEGDTPVVSSSSANNGVAMFGDVSPSAPAGALSVAMTGSVGFTSVHAERWFCTANSSVLTPLGDYPLDSMLMFAGLLTSHFQERYSYKDILSLPRVREHFLRLPATPTGEPDWGYMEQVMKERLDRAEAALDVLQSLVGA